MLVFGCCVGPSGKFDTVAAPALEAVMSAEDLLVREQGSDGICAAYNRILETARHTAGCEGVVLLHDDTALGAGAREQILAGLREASVGVVGAVGGRDLHGPIWVDARRTAGVANDVYGRREYGPALADVDVVDGLLLALAPAAFQHLDFDRTHFPAFHAYDTDYCLQVRARGLRVRVVPIDYLHVDKGDLGDREAFERGFAHLRAKWPDRIRPLGPAERRWRAIRQRAATLSGEARHRLASTLKSLPSRRP